MTFENLPNSDCDGPVDWIKPPRTSGSFYPAGFSSSLGLQAAKYAQPALASGTITLDGGNLPAPGIMDNLTIYQNKVTITGTNEITLTVTPRTGAFNGHYLNPATNKKAPLSGVIYQKPASAGYGLFLGADQSGPLEITP